MQRDYLPFEMPDPGPLQDRSQERRGLGRWLPIIIAIVIAMIAIPAFTLGIFGAFDEASAQEERILLSDLPSLHRREQERANTELQELRDWVREYFTDDEIAFIKEKFLGDRDEAEVREELRGYAETLSRGDYLSIPREYSDRIKSNLGSVHVLELKERLEALHPTERELLKIAEGELFHFD